MSATVKDVMSTHVMAVRQGASYKEMATVLHEQRVSAFPVIDEDNKVIGVVSEGDPLAKEALNFAVDRAAALTVSEAVPEIKLMALENRKFLRRAVRYLAAEAGIAQFLDIGTGLPTQGNVHQVAQQVNPDARVVYVDNDPMVLAHSRALKTGGNAAVIQADLRDPAAILTHPRTRELIDFHQPLALLLVAVLHFVGGDDDPYAITGSLCEAMAPGSHLVVSHATGGILSGDSAEKVADHYRKTVAPGSTLRDRDEILRFFTGFELADPGLVQVPYWRPDEPGSPDAGKVQVLGAVGRKPSEDGA